MKMPFDELEFALETADGTPFEELAASILREKGYRVKESDVYGTDGGWDAFVEVGAREGIAHASVQDRWKRKLRKDCDSAEDLEDEQGKEFDVFVYVTNQRVNGNTELDLQEEVQEKYGWNLEIYHRQNLLGIMRDEPMLAKQQLGVDLNVDRDHLEELRYLRDQRLEAIRDRSGEADCLPDRAAAATHVIPNSIFSTDPVLDLDEVPTPRVLGEFGAQFYNSTSGKAQLAHANTNVDNNPKGYAKLRNDGLYESVSTQLFVQRDGNQFVKSAHNSYGVGFSAAFIIAARDALEDLSSMGVSGSATIWISLLDANDAKLEISPVRRFLKGRSQFGTDCYTTERITIPIGEHSHDYITEQLSPILDELWRAFGIEDGCDKIKEGSWDGESFRADGSEFP